MDLRRVCSLIGLAALSLAGCAHHYIGWPPTPAEIDKINRVARNGDGSSLMALIPVAPIEADDDAVEFQPVRPIVDRSLPDIRQVLSADAATLTIVDKKGATQRISLSVVDGFATTNRLRSAQRSPPSSW